MNTRKPAAGAEIQGGPEQRTADRCRVAYCRALNLRSEPGGAVLTVLEVGTPVTVDGTGWRSDGTAVWVKAGVDGLYGWVDARYLDWEERKPCP